MITLTGSHGRKDDYDYDGYKIKEIQMHKQKG
jgi:hypothetical protein